MKDCLLFCLPVAPPSPPVRLSCVMSLWMCLCVHQRQWLLFHTSGPHNCRQRTYISGTPSRPRDSVNECNAMQRSCDIWAFQSHSPNSISKGWLVWLEQRKWRIKESRWIAAQLKLENAFMSSSDFRATIRRWNRSCGSTWIFSPSNLTDDFVARVTAWLLRFKANSMTNVPVNWR